MYQLLCLYLSFGLSVLFGVLSPQLTMHYQFLLQPEISAVVAAGSTRITFQSRRPSAASSSERGERRSRASTRYGTRVSCDDLLGTIKIGGWNPTHLTSVFSLWTSVALPHGTMLTAFADVRWVGFHPPR